VARSKRDRGAAAKTERAARLWGRARWVRARRVALWVAGVGAVLAAMALLSRSTTVGVSFAGDLREGGVLGRLTLPALEGDGMIDYAELDDRPLVINFFASRCPACIAEMPGFEQVHQALSGRVGFLGISQSDALSSSIELARETGVTYPTGYDAKGAFFRAVGGVGMPTTVFVLPGGRIAHVQVGALDPLSLRALIDNHLGVEA
jgi:cytochrome c biogenesis protein CcmG, thiol:disulfide interchange protein DsbE